MDQRIRGFALLLLLIPALGLAQAYRWVDENGKVHYSQTPPSKGDYGLVAPAPPPGKSPNVEALSEYAASLDKEQADRREHAGKTLARQQARCTQARRQKAQFEVDGRYYSTNEKGERSYLNAQQIDQRREAAQAAVQEHCP